MSLARATFGGAGGKIPITSATNAAWEVTRWNSTAGAPVGWLPATTVTEMTQQADRMKAANPAFQRHAILDENGDVIKGMPYNSKVTGMRVTGKRGIRIINARLADKIDREEEEADRRAAYVVGKLKSGRSYMTWLDYPQTDFGVDTWPEGIDGSFPGWRASRDPDIIAKYAEAVALTKANGTIAGITLNSNQNAAYLGIAKVIFWIKYSPLACFDIDEVPIYGSNVEGVEEMVEGKGQGASNPSNGDLVA